MYTEQFKVRFCETDALAHVNNTVLAAWFETAREPIFRLFNPQLDLQNWPLILASYKIDFLKQISYGEPVEVRTYICRLGNSSFDTFQEVWQCGEKCGSGTTTMVHFDYQTNKSVAIQGQLRAQLASHMLQADE